MSNLDSQFHRRQPKRDQSGRTDFRRGITPALFVKCCLLGILGWSFFAGQKVPVDAGSVARVLLEAPMKP